MSQTYELDGIIRRLSSAESSSQASRGEKRLIYDAGRDVFLKKRPIFSLGRDIHDYSVRPGRTVECRGPSCRFRCIKNSHAVEFRIDYEAWCKHGRQEDLVRALHDGDHPNQVVDELIQETLESFVLRKRAEDRDFVREFFDMRAEAKKAIEDCAEKDLALNVSISIQPVLDEKIEAVSIVTGHFEARPSDSNRPITIECSTEAEVDPEHRMSALLYYDETHKLQHYVQEAIRGVLADQITLHSLAQEFVWKQPPLDASTRVESHLIRAINSKLQEYGRRILFIKVRMPDLEKIPPIDIAHSVSCKIRECEDPIVVQHQLILRPRDLGIIQRSEVGDAKEWIKERLDWETRRNLFEKTYLKLLLNFDENEIKNIIIKQAEAIGYSIQQMVSIPDLEPLSWRDGLMVEGEEETFATHTSRISVGLKIIVSGKIEQLDREEIKPYLNPQSHRIRTDIRKAVREKAQEELYKVDAERFYMRFQNSDIAGEPPVSEMLENSIRERLETRFAMSDITVTFQHLETELTERLRELLNGPHTVVVDCLPFRSGGRRELVEFEIEFIVAGVHQQGWFVFCNKKVESAAEELQKIKSVLYSEIKSSLETVPADKLQYVQRSDQHQLATIIAPPCRKKILISFGLEIGISNVRRKATQGELGNLEILQHDIVVNTEGGKKAALKAGDEVMAKLEMLHARELELLKAGIDEDDPELLAVRKQIREINDEILPYRSREERDHVRMLPAEADRFDIEDYHQGLISDGALRKLLVDGKSNEDSDP